MWHYAERPLTGPLTFCSKGMPRAGQGVFALSFASVFV